MDPNIMQALKADIPRRLDKARQAAVDRGIDALLIVGRSFYDRPGNLAYLSNHFPPFPTSPFIGPFQGLGHAVLVLPLADPPALITDSEFFRAEYLAIEDVRPTGELTQGIIDVSLEKGLGNSLIGIVGSDIMPANMYRVLLEAIPGARFRFVDEMLEEMRSVKSEVEIDALRKSAEIGHLGLMAAHRAAEPGASEHVLCAAGAKACLEAGADFVRYVRVHSGPWSLWPTRWPQATDRVLEAGDLINLDVIGALHGYQFDIQRSTVVGEPSQELESMLEICVEATDVAVDAAREGVTVADVVQAGAKVLKDGGYGEFMTGLGFSGHGIGLETIELPFLTPGDQTELRSGMVLCVEPGLRIPELGGCAHEHEIVVRDGPPEILSKTPLALWQV